MSMSEYWRGLQSAMIQSWTLRTALFWTLVTALAENISMFSTVVDAKYYPYVVTATIALSRLKGLSADVKARK